MRTLRKFFVVCMFVLLTALSVNFTMPFNARAEEEASALPSNALLNAMRSTPYPQVITDLIARGANLNAMDAYNRTPLMIAVERKSVAIVKLLITAGANINARDSMDTTALMRAEILDASGIINELKLAGAEYTQQDEVVVELEKKKIAESIERRQRLLDAKKIADKLKDDIRRMEAEIATEQAEAAKKLKKMEQPPEEKK